MPPFWLVVTSFLLKGVLPLQTNGKRRADWRSDFVSNRCRAQREKFFPSELLPEKNNNGKNLPYPAKAAL